MSNTSTHVDKMYLTYDEMSEVERRAIIDDVRFTAATEMSPRPHIWLSMKNVVRQPPKPPRVEYRLPKKGESYVLSGKNEPVVALMNFTHGREWVIIKEVS